VVQLVAQVKERGCQCVVLHMSTPLIQISRPNITTKIKNNTDFDCDTKKGDRSLLGIKEFCALKNEPSSLTAGAKVQIYESR